MTSKGCEGCARRLTESYDHTFAIHYCDPYAIFGSRYGLFTSEEEASSEERHFRDKSVWV